MQPGTADSKQHQRSCARCKTAGIQAHICTTTAARALCTTPIILPGFALQQQPQSKCPFQPLAYLRQLLLQARVFILQWLQLKHLFQQILDALLGPRLTLQ